VWENLFEKNLFIYFLDKIHKRILIFENEGKQASDREALDFTNLRLCKTKTENIRCKEEISL
jgi:hypothetical protein